MSLWLDAVNENKEDLRQLVRNYHPASSTGRRENLSITAPGAEAACVAVRELIAKESPDVSPVELFDEALKAGNIPKIYGLLNSAWFGVPESTSCWSIPGFRVAVDLLDGTIPRPDER